MALTLEQITNDIRNRVGEHSGLNCKLKIDLRQDGVIHIDARSIPNCVSNDDLSADCTIACSLDTFSRIHTGETTPPAAMLRGQLKIQGDMLQAMKLRKIMEA